MNKCAFRAGLDSGTDSVSGNKGRGPLLRLEPSRTVPRLRWWLAGLLLSLGFARSSHAQDVILRTDGTRTEARVLKVSGQEVFYKLWTDTTTLTTVLVASVVASIRYANGTEHTFPRPDKPAGQGTDFNAPNQLNVLSIRPSDLRFNNLTFGFERLLGQGEVGLKVPVTFGLSRDRWDCYQETSTFYQSNKIFSTGLEINLYSNPQKRLRFFGGPAFHYGRFHYPYITPVPYTYTYTILFFFPYTTTVTPKEVKVGEQIALLGQGGVVYRLTKSLLVGADAGVGLQYLNINRHSLYPYSDQLNESQLLISGNVNIGFTF